MGDAVEERDTRAELEVSSPEVFLNRELSWLAFNERVLEEAADASWPLLERMKFLAIHSANLDEFFMIRVSALREQLEIDIGEKSLDGMTARQQLDAISKRVRAQLVRATELLHKELLPALEKKAIYFVTWESLDAELQGLAREYFRRAVFPVLTPLAVDPAHPFPFISNLSLSLAIEVRDPEKKEVKFARVKVPESLPRFYPCQAIEHSVTGRPNDAEDRGPVHLLPLEDLIRANLDALFPGMEVVSCHPIRITRDMDLEIREEEAHDLLSVIDRELRQRRFGAVVRLETVPDLPESTRQLLLEKLELAPEELYEMPPPLGLGAFMAVAQLPRRDLKDPPLTPELPRPFVEHTDPFAAIAESDVLVHLPYDSFAPVLHLLAHAADDPQVLAIKMTLYRTGRNAQLVQSLIRAAENGKQVAVSIELKARFDEQANIQWARALERAGIHVFYGVSGYKTHAKVLMVVRSEGEALERYVHLSTGNYNESTSKVYTDLGFFTCRPDIGEDASELFNALSGFSKAPHYRTLAVAPKTLAPALLAKIDAQAERAKQGKPSGIFAKMNALVDDAVIRALYRASRAGVPIQLAVRGVCCLRPGVPGLSESIRVCSVVGRFLEHERLFVFGPQGEEEFFIASADWMPRNLYRRVEVMCPIEDKRLREQLRAEVIDPVLADNSRARDLDASGEYHRRHPAQGEPVRDAQLATLGRSSRPQLRPVPPARKERLKRAPRG